MLPPGASEACGLLAALDAASAPRILSLGADVLPAGRGWLAPWLHRPSEARPILGGLLVDFSGSLPDGSLPAEHLPRRPSATDRVSAACVGLTREIADLLAADTPFYPDPDVMLASVVKAFRRKGCPAQVRPQCRFVRYRAPVAPDAFADAVTAEAMARVLKPLFRTGGQEVWL